MKLIYNILLLILLSIPISVGRLFELFIWRNHITQTESIFQAGSVVRKGKCCSFIKARTEINVRHYTDYQQKLQFVLSEIHLTIKSCQTFLQLKQRYVEYKNQKIRIFIFNVSYSDNPKKALVIC